MRLPLESPLVWLAFATAAYEAGREVLSPKSAAHPGGRTASAAAPVTPVVAPHAGLEGKRI